MRKTKADLDEELSKMSNEHEELRQILVQANAELKKFQAVNERQNTFLHVLVDLISGKSTKLS